MMAAGFLDKVNWNNEGLVPVVTQDHSSGRLLTQAWINREALGTAIKEKRAVYWSRSRQSIWRKGEESGNIQELINVFLDCDNDSICFVVRQIGGIACHTGRESCFFHKLVDNEWQIVDPVLRDPSAMYSKSNP